MPPLDGVRDFRKNQKYYDQLKNVWPEKQRVGKKKG